MAITRLQQARQMYAMGQRVGGIMGSNAGSMLVTPTRDGSRPGYYGPDAGHENDPGHGSNAPGGNGDARDKAIANQYKNMPTPTVTVGVDKFDNPIEIKTTYTDKRNRQKTLDALNKKGISSFDPRVTKTGINFLDPNNLINSFAPKQQNKFGLFDLALLAASGGLLGPKIATGAKMFNTAKNVSKLAQTIGLTDKNVLDSFTSNFTENFGKGKKSTTKSTSTNNNNGGGGEGLASLDNQASGYDEYILLLQKLQSGTISDAERNRYNVLKNMLGI
jgi:hypothetical protein